MTDSFDDPKRIAINRVYTGKGDAGLTSLVGGQKVPKQSARIGAYGSVDELNSHVGVAAVEAAACARAAEGDAADALAAFANDLVRVQHQLFNLGSILATLPDDVHPNQPRVRDADAAWLEEAMDACNARLEPLRSFTLPGGSRLSALLHVCRTVCRRVERDVCGLAELEAVDAPSLVYLNRLSDAFFVWSRWANVVLSAEELLWRPNAADGEA